MSEPREVTGDPWIDAYMIFRWAWVQGGTEGALTDLARELKQELPSSTPPIPAALFIHRDILITSQRNTLPRQLITALWVPHHAHASS